MRDRETHHPEGDNTPAGFGSADFLSPAETPTQMTEKIYLAGPIQHVNDYGKGWRLWLRENRGDYEWVDPMEKYNTMEEAAEEWSVPEIVENDLDMIDGCDGLLAHWEAVPTAGTPMEIFYAARERDIPVVIQSTLQQEDMSVWVEYHADAIVEDFDGAIKAFDRLFDQATA